jgi:hypothetical protein
MAVPPPAAAALDGGLPPPPGWKFAATLSPWLSSAAAPRTAIIAAFSKTPDSKKAHGLTQGKLLYTIAIAHLPLGWWYTSHFPLLITGVIAFRQYA